MLDEMIAKFEEMLKENNPFEDGFLDGRLEKSTDGGYKDRMMNFMLACYMNGYLKHQQEVLQAGADMLGEAILHSVSTQSKPH